MLLCVPPKILCCSSVCLASDWLLLQVSLFELLAHYTPESIDDANWACCYALPTPWSCSGDLMGIHSSSQSYY